MTVTRRWILWGLCLLVPMLGARPLAAQDARLTDLTVTNTRAALLLYLSVDGAFREETTQAILSGLPASFSFFTSLHRVRKFWLDEEIADIEATHTLRYDTLKKEFTVTRSWDGDGPRVTQSFAEARRWMSTVDGLKVVGLDRLEKGSAYQLRAKAELSKLTLPFYLHYVLFFVSLWDFETDWYTVDFIY